MNESHDPFNSTPAPQVDLSQYDADFAQTEAAESDDVPDGKYQIRVQSARLNKSQGGNPMLQFDLVVLSGQHAGRHIFKNAVITPASMPFFKADLKVLGIDLPKLSDLPGRLDAMLDQTLEVTKKTKGEYANVYFNKRLKVPAGTASSAPAATSRDAVPF